MRHVLKTVLLSAGLVIALGGAGCAATPMPSRIELAERAEACLRLGMRYPENPLVRAPSIEAAADVLGRSAAPAIREGLRDEHMGVRFAACLALGELRHEDAVDELKALATQGEPSVRVGAWYALERMGDFSWRADWVKTLQEHADPLVRRNAVMTLGLLRDPKTRRLLAKVHKADVDETVRLLAMEALVALGDDGAISMLPHDAFGSLGFRQPFAILALGHAPGDDVVGQLRARLAGAPYLETRLAAARALAMHGIMDGYQLAVQSLSWNSPQRNLPEDTPETQIMRVRTMAAMAVGQIGDPGGLEPLFRMMESTSDMRLQVAAARAILNIERKSPQNAPAVPLKPPGP